MAFHSPQYGHTGDQTTSRIQTASRNVGIVGSSVVAFQLGRFTNELLKKGISKLTLMIELRSLCYWWRISVRPMWLRDSRVLSVARGVASSLHVSLSQQSGICLLITSVFDYSHPQLSYEPPESRHQYFGYQTLPTLTKNNRL